MTRTRATRVFPEGPVQSKPARSSTYMVLDRAGFFLSVANEGRNQPSNRPVSGYSIKAVNDYRPASSLKTGSARRVSWSFWSS